MTPPPRRRGTDDGFSSAGGGRYGRRPPAGGPRGGDRSDTPAGRRYGKSDDRRFAAGGGGRPHDRGWRKGERDGSGGQRERYGSDRFGGSAAEGGYRGKEDRFAADRRRGRYQDGSSDERAGRRSDNRGGDQWRHGERDDLSRDDRSRGGFPGPDRGRFRPEASGERRRDGRDGGRTGGFKRAGERDSGRFQRRDQAPDAWSHGLRPARPDDAGLADDLVWGRHAAEAVLSSDRPIHRIWCTPELRFTARFMQLLREAKAAGVVVEEVTWTRLVQLCGGAVHQGIVLQTAAAATLDLDELLELCRGISEAPLVMAVDGVTDPHNLGAIVRTAEALGANGMVIPQRRNAGLTGTVAKVAAGALEHLPVARVVNLNRSLEQLKLDGYTVVGLAEEGDMRITEVPAGGPLVVVTGSEGSGLSLMTRKHCDHLVSIPLRGETTSLNASVATGMVLYEIARKRWLGKLSGTMPPPPLAKRQRSRPGQAPCEPAEAVEPATAAAETLPAADISTTSTATATSTAVAAANGIAHSEAVPSMSRQDIAAPLPPTLDDGDPPRPDGLADGSAEPAEEAVESATAAAETLPAADISTTSAATATSTAVAAANAVAHSEAVPSNSRQDIAAPLPPTLDDGDPPRPDGLADGSAESAEEAVEPATAAAETLPAADISTTSAATATSTAVAAANGIAHSEAVPSNSRQDIAAPLPPTLDDGDPPRPDGLADGSAEPAEEAVEPATAAAETLPAADISTTSAATATSTAVATVADPAVASVLDLDAPAPQAFCSDISL